MALVKKILDLNPNTTQLLNISLVESQWKILKLKREALIFL